MHDVNGTRCGGLVLAVALLMAAPAVAQECTQELDRIEAQVQDAELTRRQQAYVRELIDTARLHAEGGNLRACNDTIIDLAEYADEEAIDIPLAEEVGSRAPFVADTPLPTPGDEDEGG